MLGGWVARMCSASGAFAPLDTRSGGSFFAIVYDILQVLGGHDAVKSVFEMGKVKLLVHLFFQCLVVKGDFLFRILIAPLESLQSVGFRQTIYVNKLSR